jgi:hypothetical protein
MDENGGSEDHRAEIFRQEVGLRLRFPSAAQSSKTKTGTQQRKRAILFEPGC